MYFAVVILTMLVLPVGSILAERAIAPDALPLLALVGKWFVFWGVGIRLLLAGLRQFFQPRFTAEQIFHMKSDEALVLVRELGVANIASGIVAVWSLAETAFVLPSAIYAAIFYGVAGTRHLAELRKSRNETIAMVSDLFMAAVLAGFAAMMLAS